MGARQGNSMIVEIKYMRQPGKGSQEEEEGLEWNGISTDKSKCGLMCPFLLGMRIGHMTSNPKPSCDRHMWPNDRHCKILALFYPINITN